MQGTNPGARRRGRPCTSISGQESPWKSQVRMTAYRESMSMVWQTLGSRTAKEQNRTDLAFASSYS